MKCTLFCVVSADVCDSGGLQPVTSGVPHIQWLEGDRAVSSDPTPLSAVPLRPSPLSLLLSLHPLDTHHILLPPLLLLLLPRPRPHYRPTPTQVLRASRPNSLGHHQASSNDLWRPSWTSPHQLPGPGARLPALFFHPRLHRRSRAPQATAGGTSWLLL